MTNWKTYKITSVSPSSGWIGFDLDGSVNFKGGSSSNHIYCKNYSPFSGWYSGNRVEIDNDQTCYRDSTYDFTSTSQVRLASGYSHAEYDSLRTRCSSLESENYSLRSDRDHWKREHGKLEREKNDLRDDRDNLASGQDEWRKKHEDIKTQLSGELSAEKLRNANALANERLSRQNTESTLRSEKVVVEQKLESAKNEKTGLVKQIEDVKNELSLVRVEKDNQLVLVKEVEKTMANLRIEYEKDKTEKDAEINRKDGELQRKEEQIENLLSQKEFSQEELLIERLRSEKQNLELFATELKVDLEKTESLIRDHDQLFQVKKTRNRTDITTYENNITQTKKNLRNSGVSIISIQEICRKCEKIAELNWELSQIQQQYQAYQEVPTNQ